MNLPDPTPVTDLIDAFRRSKTMFAAVSMGVFDILAEGPADLDMLAHRLKAKPASLERLLDACACLGFLRKQDGQYSNQPVADVYLTKKSPNTLTGYIEYSDTVLYKMWGHLDDAVREGTHRWRQTFDFEGPSPTIPFIEESASMIDPTSNPTRREVLRARTHAAAV